MIEFLKREEILLGKENLEKIFKKKILLFGIGGVGSYAFEALIRNGFRNICVVDFDNVDITNINRQLLAYYTTISKKKVDIAKKRVEEIVGKENMEKLKYNMKYISDFADSSNISKIIEEEKPDYIIDAIDSYDSKVEILKIAEKLNIFVVSSMGAGGKIDPSKIKVARLSKTKECKIAKKLRKDLRNISDPIVVYSEEQSKKGRLENSKIVIGTIMQIPAIFGLLISSEILKRTIEN